MYNATFFGTFDVTALVLTVFVLFFIGLIVYLRREDRREGYPIEDDVSGRAEPAQGLFWVAPPKTFRLPHGGGVVSKPDGISDSHEIAAARRSPVSGTPLQPVGDPLLAGVGPGAFAHRLRAPDLTDHGALKITPLRDAPDFLVDSRDRDPRGMAVLGADGKVAGAVSDIWIDRGEIMIRYLEVALPAAGLAVVGAEGAGRRVLLPMTMAVVSGRTRTVKTNAILADQFAGVPALANPDQVTRDEEERICAYYGGGYLYATAARAEPLI